MSVFNSPLLLGFENFERLLDRASKASSEGYPPYNIEQTSDNGLRITLAVAGFSMEDLSVTMEDNELVIRGRQNDDASERNFIYRGIAARQFQRSYILAEEILELKLIVSKEKFTYFNISKKLKSDDYFYQRSVEYLYPIRLNEKFKKTFFSRNEEIPSTCNILKKYKQLILVEC